MLSIRRKHPNPFTSTIFLLSLILFVGAFICSFILYLTDGTRSAKRVLFFPVFGSIALEGEERFVPRQATLEEDIELAVKELILGPKEPYHVKVLPANVKIDSILYRNGELYCSFSEEILFRDASSPLNLEEMVQAVGNSILFNFPRLKRVHPFVNGQIPGKYKFEEDGIQFSSAMLE